MKIVLDKTYQNSQGIVVTVKLCQDVLIDGEPAVVFQKTGLDQYGMAYPMEAAKVSDFKQNFFPEYLSIGDEVVYMSMGKILRKLEINSMAGNNLQGVDKSGKRAIFFKRISNTTELTLLQKEDWLVQDGQFFYVTPLLKRQMEYRNIKAEVAFEFKELLDFLDEQNADNINLSDLEVQVKSLQVACHNIRNFVGTEK